MSEHRTGGRRASQRAFRPTLDCQMESRLLLSHAKVVHPAAIHTAAVPAGDPPLKFQTANGGRAVIITDVDGSQFEVTVTSALQVTGTPAVTLGTVRARRMPGGRVGLTVFGTTADSILAINPVTKSPVKGNAHDFASGQAANDRVLNIGEVRIVSGSIGQVVGYHSANLSGPIIAPNVTPVNRIAFENLLPGAAIAVGGDLNTLDVLQNIDLEGGPGIQVGRDLNWINAGGNLTLATGSSLIVGRDLGLFPQPAKGTGPAGQGGFVGGNLIVGPGSQIFITRSLGAPFVVEGNGAGITNIVIGQPSANAFVFRPGAIVLP
jgi:hypothetical protein